MENQWKISFENMGMSSYLAVTFPLGTDVIGYQMEMITSNEINHLLRASKRMINGQTGKMIGKLPLDYGRIGIGYVLLSAVIFLLLTLLGLFM